MGTSVSVRSRASSVRDGDVQPEHGLVGQFHDFEQYAASAGGPDADLRVEAGGGYVDVAVLGRGFAGAGG
jgi:hypothetical protein